MLNLVKNIYDQYFNTSSIINKINFFKEQIIQDIEIYDKCFCCIFFTKYKYEYNIITLRDLPICYGGIYPFD